MEGMCLWYKIMMLVAILGSKINSTRQVEKALIRHLSMRAMVVSRATTAQSVTSPHDVDGKAGQWRRMWRPYRRSPTWEEIGRVRYFWG